MITTMHSDQNASPPRVEVITSVQRRRRWPTAESAARAAQAEPVGIYRQIRPSGGGTADLIILHSHVWSAQCP